MARKDELGPGGNDRHTLRYPTKFDGILIVDRSPIPVDVSNLSRVGGCVRGPGLPDRGQEVTLAACGLEVVGTVVCNRNGACGMNFHKPIDPLHVVRHNMDVPGRRRPPAVPSQFTIELR